MRSPKPTRRRFLGRSAAVAGGTSAAAWAAPALAQGRSSPNERIRVAVVGVRGRGRSHVRALQKLSDQNVEVAAVCDVYQPALEACAEQCRQAAGKRPATFVDYRDLVSDGSIDAVSLATPDHWHALQTIWACQAGKHVYVEKVAAHNLREGRLMVEAARKYDRVVQLGTQARSSANIQQAVRKLREGVIGRVYMARAIAYKYRAGGKNEFRDPPPGLDWNLWQGPAPERRFNMLAFSPRWRFVQEYGNGQIGAQGVHQFDMIRWALGLNRHPVTIQSLGGNYSRPTCDETWPTEMSVSYQFDEPELMVTFENRTGYTNPEGGMGTKYPWVNGRDVVGAIFFGSEGYMIIPDFSNFHTFLGPKHEPGPSSPPTKPTLEDDGHFQNWVAALRAGDRSVLAAEILEGHLSSSMVYLGNIAWQTGRTLHFDPDKERFRNDAEADRLLFSEYRPPFELPRDL